MPKTRAQKEKTVEELIDKLNRIKSAVFTNYKDLTAGEIQELREKMSEQDIDYKVVKITLLKIAQAKSNLKDIKLPEIEKPLAIAFGYQDEVLPAKIIDEFSKEHEALEMICGILDGKLLGKEEIESLAKLPSKEELLAKVVYTIKSPVSGLVNVMAGSLRNLAGVLRAITSK